MTKPTGFQEWVNRVARDLSVRREDLDDDTPGSFSEAVTYLTSPRVLGPKESDLPGVYVRAGDEEHVVLAAYSAAFVPPGDFTGTVEVLFSTDHPHEGSFVDVVVVLWERSEGEGGRDTARVVASLRKAPLSSFACRNVGDLEGLYRFVKSSEHGKA